MDIISISAGFFVGIISRPIVNSAASYINGLRYKSATISLPDDQNHVYRYILVDDIPAYAAAAKMDCFELNIKNVAMGFATLHIKLFDEQRLKNRGLILIR